MTVLDKLFIVVNGQVNEAGLMIFRRYTENILVRENKGFDAGAYADVILNVLGESIQGWDEVVLCNDTFFGPFIPMQAIFDEMESKEVDFWGLNLCDRKALSHIESYFLVFDERCIQSGELLHFFKTHINPHEEYLADVILKFEKGIWNYLTDRGYSFATYTNAELYHVYLWPNICVQKYNLPILKKKAFAKEYRNDYEISNVLRYIINHSNYDVVHILQCAQRKYGFSWESGRVYESSVPPEKMSRFRYLKEELLELVGGRNFYIYGTGKVAYMVYHFCLCRTDGLKGFVLSDSEEIRSSAIYGLPIFHYSEIPKDALLVLCVSKKITEEIKPGINKSHKIIELWE